MCGRRDPNFDLQIYIIKFSDWLCKYDGQILGCVGEGQAQTLLSGEFIDRNLSKYGLICGVRDARRANTLQRHWGKPNDAYHLTAWIDLQGCDNNTDTFDWFLTYKMFSCVRRHSVSQTIHSITTMTITICFIHPSGKLKLLFDRTIH